MTRLFDAFCAAAQARRGELFDAVAPLTAAAAPGWVDLIGGATAYGGSLALGWPTGAATFVALQPDPEPLIRLFVDDQSYSLPCAALTDTAGWPCTFTELTTYTRAAAPPLSALLGIWVALMREEFVRFPGGVRVWMQPAAGPGAAASQAVALAQALVTAFAVKLAPRELALAVEVALTHTVHLAGALGPMVSLCAPAAHLLLLHQQPAWHWGDLHLPHGAAIWTLTVGGPEPQAAPPGLRAAAQQAYAAIAALEGLRQDAADRRWQGYLANIDGPAFERRYRAALTGVSVEDSVAPPPQAAAALAIGDHLRARTIAALLRAAASKPQRDDDLRLIGELLLHAHAAQYAAGLTNAHADALLAQVLAHGPDQGLFGARMPAPASGATLVILGQSDADALVHNLAAAYAAQIGVLVSVTAGSAPGASPAGARMILL
jgi:galactokinase